MPSALKRVPIPPPERVLTDEYDLLPPMQQQFVDAYIGPARQNHREAAQLAGYCNGEVLKCGPMGWRLIKNPLIQKAINERLNRFALQAEEILFQLTERAGATLADYYDIDKHGKPQLNLNRPQAQGRLHLIKAIVYNREGKPVGVEIHSQLDALNSLAKARGLHDMNVRHHITGDPGVVSFQVNMPGALPAPTPATEDAPLDVEYEPAEPDPAVSDP